MSRYDDWDDEAFDLAQDERDEERQAMQGEADAEFDDEFATDECSIQNPECAWVTEHHPSGMPFHWCETHD